jgi:hypothetical protein
MVYRLLHIVYHTSNFLSLWLYSPCGPWPIFSFLILYTVGSTPWTGDQPVTKPLPTHRTTQEQNKSTQTSMPRVGFEPTIPVFQRAKTVHASDLAATVIGHTSHINIYISKYYQRTQNRNDTLKKNTARSFVTLYNLRLCTVLKLDNSLLW